MRDGLLQKIYQILIRWTNSFSPRDKTPDSRYKLSETFGKLRNGSGVDGSGTFFQFIQIWARKVQGFSTPKCT